MQSVARHLPEARRLVYCVDAWPDAIRPADEAFELVAISGLELPRFRQLAFALPATGLCCALKPQVIRHAFEALCAERVIYFDNDTLLYRRPHELLDASLTSDLVLTPHLTEPVPTGNLPDEKVIRPYGIFNAGLFAVRNSPAGQAFLSWWGSLLLDPRNLRAETGWDQSWLDFASSFVSQCTVLRHPGYNVASWNLASRPLTRAADEWLAKDAPLTLMHFSSFDDRHPEHLIRPGLTCNYQPTPEVIELSRAYAAELAAAGANQCRAWDYGFGTFLDGSAITAEQRALFASHLWALTPPGADPFDPAFEIGEYRGRQSLYAQRQSGPTLRHRVGRQVRRMLSS